MRICLISREYPPETGWGGIATFTRHLAHGLKEIGHDVEVVSLSRGEDHLQDDEGIPVHRVKQEWLGERLGTISMCMPYSRYVLMTSTALWRKFFQLHVKKPFDVVDTPELLAEGLFPAISRALPLLIRLYTPHSKFIKEKLHNVTPSFDHEFVAGVERVAMLSADVLPSPSQDLARFVADDLNYDLEKIAIVRNPIDPGQFSPDGKVALEKSDKVRVLFVGRLEERKGIHYLVDAIPKVTARHKNVEFVIIGDDTNNATGQRSVLAELKAKIERDGTGRFIKFISRIPLDELPAHYRSADISIVPSVYDNSPYTCQEAMSCGNPVIGTNSGGTAEYLEHGVSGLAIPPRDSDAIAEALNTLIGDEKKRTEMGSAARKRVVEEFDRKEIARQTAELYELGQQRFLARSESSMYRKEPEEMLQDAHFMLAAFDKMIYDTLYQYSWRFRFRHWGRIIKKRPRLFLAKLGARVMGAVDRATGHRVNSFHNLSQWLAEESVRRSQDLPIDHLLRVDRSEMEPTAGQQRADMDDKFASLGK